MTVRRSGSREENRMIRSIEGGAGARLAFERITKPYRQEALREKDFVDDPYSASDVQKDGQVLIDLKKTARYQAARSEASQALEFIVIHGMSKPGIDWLGSDFERAVKTSEHDDWQNGIDLVVTFRDENDQEVHLGIDVTTKESESDLHEKISPLYKNAERQDLSRVKYFEDMDGRKGEITLPRVLLGLDAQTTLALRDQMIKAEQYSGARKAVAESQQMFEFLYSTEAQLAFSLEQGLKAAGELPREGLSTEKLLEHVESVRAKTKNPKLQKFIEAHSGLLKLISKVRKEKDPLRKAAGVTIAPVPGKPLTYLSDRQNLARLAQ